MKTEKYIIYNQPSSYKNKITGKREPAIVTNFVRILQNICV